MLHPVGKLPAAVYWRRRALVLLVLLSVVGGGGWLAATGLGHWRANVATASATSPTTVPALDQVVPSPAGLQAAASAVPCSDGMIGVSVQAATRAAVGARVSLKLVVANTSATPCLQALDQTLQEIVLLDAQGTRVWGSDDCTTESGHASRTLTPGEAVSIPVDWDGRTSAPTCSGARVPPPPGQYVLRGRLGTKVSADSALTLG